MELTNQGAGGADVEEILGHIEEIIHHRILSFIFDNLPAEHHKEFSLKLAKNPQNQEIWNFLQAKTEKDLTVEVENNIRRIISEILDDFVVDK